MKLPKGNPGTEAWSRLLFYQQGVADTFTKAISDNECIRMSAGSLQRFSESLRFDDYTR